MSAARENPNLSLHDRDRAILEFNRRVLAQALRDDVPLLERLRYVTIVSSNLDEFFEVRVGDIVASATSGDASAISAAAHELIQSQYAVLNDVVMPALQRAGIVVLNHAERNAAQRRWVARFFSAQVRPLLVPVGLDPSHPFPLVANKSLNFIASLDGHDAYGRANAIAIVKVPRVLPRVIALPAVPGDSCQRFVLLTSVIRAHLGELFPGRRVEWFSQFRVTRDSDVEVDADDVTNLRQALRTVLSTRNYGRAIRLEVASSCPAPLARLLLLQLDLAPQALYAVDGPVNLVRLNELIDQADAPALRFPPFEPRWPPALPRGASIFDAMRRSDLLLHHPFESFEPVVEFLRQAVADPDVLAIKQTIYRTGTQSVLMELLIEAVRRGKEVLAVVELKARFDEEANIDWADRLEAVGAQVVWGVVGLKTHAKLLLVTRREQQPSSSGRRRGRAQLRRYLHLSTGNYNPRTATLYTDLGMLTADPVLAADAENVFLQIAGQSVRPTRLLVTAPFGLHQRMVEHIAQVGAAARAGRPARIVVKLNALTEPALIDALAAAATAGARIDCIVRGACLLQPLALAGGGCIRVRSVVGRYLEHTRIVYFRWGEDDGDEVLYLSSADWMPRNMFRRVEVAWPVRDPVLRQRVIDEGLVPYLHDERDAWQPDAEGRYARVDAAGVSAQRALMQRYSQAAEAPR